MKKADDIEYLIDIDSSEEEDDNSLHSAKLTGNLKSKNVAYEELQERQIKSDPLPINPSGVEPTSSEVKINIIDFYKFVFLYYTHIFMFHATNDDSYSPYHSPYLNGSILFKHSLKSFVYCHRN